MHLVKATFWASMVYLIIPVTFLVTGWFEMQSPEWDTNDAGAVQGFAYFALASVSAFICVAVAFPLIGSKLKESFTSSKWVWTNIVFILLISYLASCIFWVYVGATSLTSALENAIILSFIIAIIALVLLAPAMFIWLLIAKATHNMTL